MPYNTGVQGVNCGKLEFPHFLGKARQGSVFSVQNRPFMEDFNKKQKTQVPWWQPGIMLFVQLSAWIAGPILIALYVGRWLDEKYGTDPWWFLGLTGIAFIITNVGLVLHTIRFIDKIKVETKKPASAEATAGKQKNKKRKNIVKWLNC